MFWATTMTVGPDSEPAEPSDPHASPETTEPSTEVQRAKAPAQIMKRLDEALATAEGKVLWPVRKAGEKVREIRGERHASPFMCPT